MFLKTKKPTLSSGFLILVAGAGFEPAASGLQDPIYSRVLTATLLLKKLYTNTALKGEGK